MNIYWVSLPEKPSEWQIAAEKDGVLVIFDATGERQALPITEYTERYPEDLVVGPLKNPDELIDSSRVQPPGQAGVQFETLCSSAVPGRLGDSLRLSVFRELARGTNGSAYVWVVEVTNAVGVIKVTSQDPDLATALRVVIGGLGARPGFPE
jgi:hypothetical protein